MASACRSASKRGQDAPGVHAGLDELQGHLAADRIGLLGHPNRPHPPFANLFQQLVAAGDHDAGRRRRDKRARLLQAAWNRPVQQVSGPVVGAQQRFDASPQDGIVRAGLIQISGPLGGGRQGRGGGKQGLSTVGGLGHGQLLGRLAVSPW